MGDWDSFLNETRTISHIHHPNILPFLGFYDQFGGDIGLVYPWISDNLDTYLIDRLDADRSQMCVQIAEGVLHLHSRGVIHGDLRPRNILVSHDGTVKITGFGGAVLEGETPNQKRYFQYVDRWAAPERMFDDEYSWRNSQLTPHTDVELAELGDDADPWIPSWPTTNSDVWSLAMTVYGALTDKMPYAGLSDLRFKYAASRQMLKPPRPDRFISIKKGFESILWSMLEACWAFNPSERPSARAVRDIMHVIEREGKTPRPKVHNPAPGALIEHTTPLSGIVEHLVAHGCRDISQQISTIDEGSRYSGRSSDVFTGKLLNGTLVAVKCLRTLSNSDTRPDKVLKHTAHELYTWSISNHPNIVELLGLTVYRNRLSMVSPWMKYGSLLSYVHGHPTVNRYGLCVQVAEGLAYMHEQGVAHGDVKGDNVVVSDSGVAKLTDFGCATMKRDFPVYFTVTESLNYSVRWAAPELFLEDGLSSFETDVYALGMTILEAITGEVPHRDRGDRVVIHAVLVKREHPTRPIEYLPTVSKPANELWDMLEWCWGYEPQDRPGINELRDFLKVIYQQDSWI